MNSVGERYVYYGPSQLENVDKVRTLLGRFWHHDDKHNKTTYGYYYNSRTKKRIERVMLNFMTDQRDREKRFVEGLPGRDARIQRRRFRKALLEGGLSGAAQETFGVSDRAYKLPRNWFKIRRKYGRLEGLYEKLSYRSDTVTTEGADGEMGTDDDQTNQVQTMTSSLLVFGMRGTAEHEVYEIELNPTFSQNMKYAPTVVLGRRLGDDEKYEYRRYKKWARLDSAGDVIRKSSDKKKNAREKYRAELGRRGTRAFIIKHMFNRVQRYINSNLGELFQDYYFEMTTPVDKILADKMNSGAGNIKVATAEQDCHYNYYLENYEKRLSNNPDVLETHLPNPYLVNFIDYVGSDMLDDSSARTVSKSHPKSSQALVNAIMAATLRYSVDIKKVSLRVGRNDDQVIKAPRRIGRSRKKKRKATQANSAYMEYLELYSEKFGNLEQSYKDDLAKRSSNIVFGAKNYQLLQDVCTKSKNIPMGAMVEFTTQRTDDEDLTKKLATSGLTSIIMSKAIEHTLELQEGAENEDTYSVRTGWTTEFPTMRVSEYDVARPAYMAKVLPKNSKLSKSDGILSFDLLDFLTKLSTLPSVPGALAPDGLDDRVESVSTMIHDGSEIPTFQVGSYAPSQVPKKGKQALAAFILLGQLNKMAKEAERSWSKLTRGLHGECRNEVVFYEIEKRQVTANGASEIIQRFWVPNFAEQEIIKFFDGQVKYDGTYKYTIHSWVAVFGTNYSYTGMAEDFDINPNGRWAIGVNTEPFIKMMRLPYMALEPIQVRDFPPVPPSVDIVPYRAVPDKFIVNFTPGVDDYLQTPESILTTDTQKFDRCYRSQYGIEGARRIRLFSEDPSKATPLRFKSDDQPKAFQIFRIEESAPVRWEDFADAFSSELNVEDGETSSLEFVTPNTDYYYMFRSVDVHGNVSNPSPIYKVRINRGQGIFTEVEPYDFEKDKIMDRSFAKQAAKSVQITPVFEQIVFKDDRQPESKKTIANQRKIRLGVAQDSIYGKKLKFRITSRKSGRKVDLNVSFIHTHKKPESD